MDDQNDRQTVCSQIKGYTRGFREWSHFGNSRLFVDNGFFGLNFDRLGLNAAFELMKKWKIKNFITTDLNRLERDIQKVDELTMLFFLRHSAISILITKTIGILKKQVSKFIDDMKVELGDK